jgi:hypothetical protein
MIILQQKKFSISPWSHKIDIYLFRKDFQVFCLSLLTNHIYSLKHHRMSCIYVVYYAIGIYSKHRRMIS